MKINRKLNFVFQVDLTDKSTGYVHAMPISKEVYLKHIILLGKVYSYIFSENLHCVSGPRIAYFLLKQICEEAKTWEGADGVENTLINEIIRLSNLVYPVEGKGYDSMPLDVAIEKGVIDLDEAINELVFFTCFSAINKPDQLAVWMDRVSLLWQSVTTFLNVTEWIDSIKTLNTEESTGEKEKTFSQKSSTIVAA